ncbi:MAG: ATP-binding protein [Anaerolineae bacterium]
MALSSPPELPDLPDLNQRIHQALSCWNRSETGPLTGLVIVQQTQIAENLSPRRAIHFVLAEALNTLKKSSPKDTKLLWQRFVEDRPVQEVAPRSGMAEATFYKHQRDAIARLTAIVAEREARARKVLLEAATQRLPWLDYQDLIGVEPVIQQIQAALIGPDAYPIVLLSGMGGLGKTSVAHATARRILSTSVAFAEAGWVSAQQEVFQPAGWIKSLPKPALTADDLLSALARQLLPAEVRQALPARQMLQEMELLLRQTPHLVIIDNLETLADVEALLPTLRRLAGPSRFLITSRKALPDEPDIFHIPLPELNADDTLALLRYEAKSRNLTVMMRATDEELRPIYEAVGGNPLALQLVVGQVFIFALDDVLDGLREARTHKEVNLYRFLYWKTWLQLGDAGQEVLLSLPAFAQIGAELPMIEQVCDVQGPALQKELERLAQLSLVNITGDLHTRRYGVHRLTQTFMLREVIRWQGYDEDWDGIKP